MTDTNERKRCTTACNKVRSKAFQDADWDGVWRWRPSPETAFRLGWMAAKEDALKRSRP